MTSKLTDVQEIWRNEERLFDEVCEIARKLKQKHPKVGYAVRLERSGGAIAGNHELPSRYSAWIFVSLNRNRTILESGRDSGEWPGACEEIIRVKSLFGKNHKLIVSDDYAQSLEAQLEDISEEYERSPFTYVENTEASNEFLKNACKVAWID